MNKLEWNLEKIAIRKRVKALGPAAWKFFVKERDKLKKDGKEIRFCWREAERLTKERFTDKAQYVWK